MTPADSTAEPPRPGVDDAAAAAAHAKLIDARPANLRAWMYAALEEGQVDTLMGRVVEIALIVLILSNVVAAALETVPQINKAMGGFFGVFEKVSIGAYTIEFILRVWSSMEEPRVAAKGPIKGRLSFALRPFMAIDFLAFAPSYLNFFLPIDLRVLRIFRLFRLLKLARYSQALPALLGVLYAERAALFASMILLLSTMCAGAELMHIVEGTIQPKTLGTIPGAMYWAITTLTTVGYGDVTPVTPLGKFIAGCFMVIGLALFALPIGIIANGFVTGLHRRRFGITWSMLKRQPLFQDLDVDAMDDVMDSINATVVREHAYVTLAGESANTLSLVVSGKGRVERAGAAFDIGPGDIVGQESLHHGREFTYTVSARTEMKLLEFPAEELRRLARKYPIIRDRIEPQAEQLANEKSLEHRLTALEAENAELRRAVADLALAKMRLEGSA